jgi:hypothetical protein
MPTKTKLHLLEVYCELSPMDRFLKGTEGDVGSQVDEEIWAERVKWDGLAADIEAEL